MQTKTLFAAFTGAGMLSSLCAGLAMAAPKDGALGLQPPNSAVMEEARAFHDHLLLPIITVISVIVLALLIWIVIRYNSKANPTPKNFSHNTLLEVVWTVIPIIILVAIALPSFNLLYKEEVLPDGKQAVARADGARTAFSIDNAFPERRRIAKAGHVDVFVREGAERRKLALGKDYGLTGLGEATVTATLTTPPPTGAEVVIEAGRGRDHRGGIILSPTVTVNAKGYQWQWSYAYPEHGVEEFYSKLLPKDRTTKELYLLEVDNRMVVPVGESIRVITQAADVIHSFALPAFGLKIDAVPGRNNETWFRADREGVFYGQCSEICGVGHAYMPIAIEVRSRAGFEEWVDAQRKLVGLDPMFAPKPVEAAAAATLAPAADAGPTASAELQATINRCQDELDALTSSETINFSTGRASISPASHGFLDRIASVAKTCDGPVITVSGHTDSTGDEATNVRLSTARAEAVRDYLAAAGFASDRIAAIGYGSAQAVADNGTPEGRARNRRIVFTVSAPTAPATTTSSDATAAQQ